MNAAKERYPSCRWPYLTIDELYDKLFPPAPPKPKKRVIIPVHMRRKRREKKPLSLVAMEHRVLLEAFKIVRYDPTQRLLKSQLKAALHDREFRTEALLRKAQALISSRGPAAGTQ